jgi:hypothetical protein
MGATPHYWAGRDNAGSKKLPTWQKSKAPESKPESH